jgi:glycosidase
MPKSLVRAIALLAGLSLLATPNLAWSAPAPKGPTAAEAAALARESVRSPMAADSIYFVMTDRYANGDTSNDRGGLTGDDLSLTGYDPTSDSYSHGGDLKGLTGGCTTGEGVARIKKMGFTTIWVTPPFKQEWVQGDSAAYHGYWINDFLTIDPHWGTNADFKAFVDCAHSQGIKVVLDIVLNHTGDVISYNGSGKAAIPAGRQNAKNPAWLNKLTNYHNRGDVQDWNDKFWAQNGDFFGLDDIKTENQEVIDGFAAVYSQWVNDYGVDGFRVDTAKHVDDAFLGKWWPKVVSATDRKSVV